MVERRSLFSIRREIRHTLARDNYIDIDIENCHPVLLYQLCTHNNIQCDYLKYYMLSFELRINIE